MFRYMAIALVVIVAGILIAAATRPDNIRVERAIRISAPAEKIFHYVNDFHQWGCLVAVGHNRATVNFQPAGHDTEVVWAMEGPSPYIAKVMGLILNMERLIGTDFETGLANLGAAGEK